MRSVRNRSAELVDFNAAGASASGVGAGKAKAPSTKSGVEEKTATYRYMGI